MAHFRLFSSNLFRNNVFREFPKRNFRSWRVLFFGSDDFSIISLEKLIRECKIIDKLEVVSVHDMTQLSKYARSKNLKLHTWPIEVKEPFDIGVVVSFGKLIPVKIIEHFPLGMINIHGSLIPRYRGAMPICHAIKNGESITGVTIMRIKPGKFDTGEIIKQESCSIGKNELMPSLRKRLAYMGAKCLLNVIDNLPESLEKTVPQNLDNVSSGGNTTPPPPCITGSRSC